MPFGCFGKRKKQDQSGPDKPGDKTAAGAADGTKTSAVEANNDKTVEDTSAEVNEVITVARSHSLHASAPNSVEHRHTTIGIQKSATLARYDFLRKSEYTNTADRWAALKQQYLQATHAGQNGSAGGGGGGGPPAKRTALSLPRQFAPPNSANTVVRFSTWFYERQTMEVDARREFHEREEKTRKLLDGVEQDSIPEDAKGDNADDVQQSARETSAEVDSAEAGPLDGAENDVEPAEAAANDRASQDQPESSPADAPPGSEATPAADLPEGGGEVAIDHPADGETAVNEHSTETAETAEIQADQIPTKQLESESRRDDDATPSTANQTVRAVEDASQAGTAAVEANSSEGHD